MATLSRRTEALLVMVSKAEKDKIHFSAQKRGMTMSAYCRMVLIDHALKDAKKDG